MRSMWNRVTGHSPSNLTGGESCFFAFILLVGDYCGKTMQQRKQRSVAISFVIRLIADSFRRAHERFVRPYNAACSFVSPWIAPIIASSLFFLSVVLVLFCTITRRVNRYCSGHAIGSCTLLIETQHSVSPSRPRWIQGNTDFGWSRLFGPMFPGHDKRRENFLFPAAKCPPGLYSSSKCDKLRCETSPRY